MKNLKYDYDFENDSLFLYWGNGDYDTSEFFDNSIAVDFNKDKAPIGIEIFKASLKFHTKKTNLQNITNGFVKISIGEKEIKFSINLSIELHSKLMPIKPINIIKCNDLNIPNTETSLAIA